MRGFVTPTLKLALCLAAASIVLVAQETQTQQPAKQEPSEAKPDPAAPATGLPVAIDPTTFKLGAEDVIEIRVWREADLSGLHVVRPDGKINMPLVKEIEVAGLTPEQVSKRITERLSEMIKEPQVFVEVRAVRSKRYYVHGEVSRPGPYPLTGPTRVFEAIALAGGFKEFANKKNIKIVRGDERLKFNYNDIVKGKNPGQNVLLENGDHIYVP